jgi:hypothetical protein
MMTPLYGRQVDESVSYVESPVETIFTQNSTHFSKLAAISTIHVISITIHCRSSGRGGEFLLLPQRHKLRIKISFN